MKLYSPATIAALQDAHGFSPAKSLGQNFLTDQNIINKIMEGADIGPEDLVIEIGPGLGVLTAAAAQRAASVIAVEIDRKLIPVLQETLSEFDNVQILQGDILKTDLRSIVEQKKAEDGQRYRNAKIIGNLPYYITSPIIMKILEEDVPVSSVTIMMQKEVADRLSARPGTKAYGALTIAVRYHCSATVVAHVPKEVFMPRPKVDSAVVRLDLHKEKAVTLSDDSIFFACVRAGFGQRRKTLLNALTGIYGLSRQAILSALTDAGIDPIRRAETLDLPEFAALANQIQGAIG